jgi:hypothetical protein
MGTKQQSSATRNNRTEGYRELGWIALRKRSTILALGLTSMNEGQRPMSVYAATKESCEQYRSFPNIKTPRQAVNDEWKDMDSVAHFIQHAGQEQQSPF